MPADISNICNNSPLCRLCNRKSPGGGGGKGGQVGEQPALSVPRAQIVACCDSARVMRDGLNALIAELPRGRSIAPPRPDESATRSYESITKLSAHSIRSAGV